MAEPQPVETYYKLHEVIEIFKFNPFNMSEMSFYRSHRHRLPFVTVRGTGMLISKTDLEHYIREEIGLKRYSIPAPTN